MNRDLLLAELRRDEGEILTSYLDTEGYWTIGVGHLIDPRKGADPAPFGKDLRFGNTITAAQSAELLERDTDEKEHQLDINLTWWRALSDVRQRVLLNMTFNLGIQGLLGFKQTLASIEAEHFDDAAHGMLNSKWAVQVGNRAKRLASMMRTGEV